MLTRHDGHPFMGTGKSVHATSPTWPAVGQTVQPFDVQALVTAGITLYAGTGNFSNDVWLNSNGTWTRMSGSPGNVRTLLAVADGTLYAGASTKRPKFIILLSLACDLINRRMG